MYIFNKLTSKDSQIMVIIRKLIIYLVEKNIYTCIIASHIPGKHNIICDKPSRFQATQGDLQISGLNNKTISKNLPPEHFIIP